MDKKTSQYHRNGVLRKGECSDWLNQRGEYAAPKEVTDRQGASNGGLRMLIVDRTSLFPPGIAMSRTEFEEAEQKLHLHHATLPSFLVANGAHSRYLRKDAKGKIVKIGEYQIASLSG